MSADLDRPILLYSIANVFKNNMKIKVSDEINENYLDGDISSEYLDMTVEEKNTYSTTAFKIVQSLMEYIPQISLVEMSQEEEVSFSYDFILHSRKCGTKYIRFTQKNDYVNGIIPHKLMKICGYRKNTNMYKSYYPEYTSITEDIYDRFSDKEKFSNLTDKQKERNVYDPVNTLVYNTLLNKRKCAAKLYEHIIDDGEAIVVRVYKRKYKIFDFGIELDADEVSSMSLKKPAADELTIKFNNGVKVELMLRNNNTDITSKLSLKYNAKITNIDELFMVRDNSI